MWSIPMCLPRAAFHWSRTVERESEWQSESLHRALRGGAEFALAAEGEHRIVVTDLGPAAGGSGISVRSL